MVFFSALCFSRFAKYFDFFSLFSYATCVKQKMAKSDKDAANRSANQICV